MKKLGLCLMTVLLLLSMSLLSTKSTSAATYHSDIPTHHRAYKEITYLSQGDIATSDHPTSFRPDAPMTRAHAAAMIGKAIQLNGTQKSTRFSDVPSSHFASGYIEESVEKGVITGYSGGIFAPDQTLTRGEMALLISRAFGYQSNSTTAAANELMRKGISKGIGNGNFGTGQLMKRGDFAVFLARAINADFRVDGQALSSSQMYVSLLDSDTLNFRQGPSTEYAVTKRLYPGYPVTVRYQVGDWVFAKVGNDHGFLHLAYLTSTQPSVGTIKEPIEVAVPAPPVASSQKKVKVIIDPGHGGHDPGAVGYGITEKATTLDIALRTKKYFAETPVDVQLTRERDVYLTLDQRVQFAKNNKGDVFISIHMNAANGKAGGTESYYYTANNPNVAQSRALTTYVQKRAMEAWGLTNRGVKTAPFYVIRWNSMPATLLEAGFIDNKKDNSYMASPTQREKMARAVYLGALDYFYHYEGRKDLAPYYSKYNARP